MAGDFNKPALSDGYTAFAQAVRDIVSDMIKGLDPALTLGTTNTPTNAIRWNSANGYWEKYNGTTWAALASTYAINTSGSAAKWVTARNIALTGDITGNGNIDGSANLSFAATLASVNANVGSFGSATQSMQITVNAKGLVTAISNVTVTPAWGSVTGKPTTIAGYGITDAAASNGSASNVFAVAAATSSAHAPTALQMQRGAFSYAGTSGTSTAYIVNFPMGLGIADGTRVLIQPHLTCGASPSILVDGAGPYYIYKRSGGTIVNLQAGEILQYFPTELIFSSTAGGFIFNSPLPRPSFATYPSGSSQTIPSGAWTKVTFGTEAFDTNNNFASSRFTPTIAGNYQLQTSLHFANSVDQTGLFVAIYKNSALHRHVIHMTSGPGEQHVSLGALVNANGTSDFFEIYCYQGTGLDRSIYSTAFDGFMVG